MSAYIDLAIDESEFFSSSSPAPWDFEDAVGRQLGGTLQAVKAHNDRLSMQHSAAYSRDGGLHAKMAKVAHTSAMMPRGRESQKRLTRHTHASEAIECSNCAKVENELESAKKDLASSLREMRELRHQWQMAITELEQLKPHRASPFDDQYFVEKWESLRHLVENFVETHLDQERDGEPMTMKEHLRLLGFVTFDPQAVRKQEKNPLLLPQSMMWWFLGNQVFGHIGKGSKFSDRGFGPANAWPIDTGGSFNKLRKVLEPKLGDDESTKEFHEWRSSTAQMLHRHPGNSMQQQRLIDNLTSGLSNCFPLAYIGDSDKFKLHLRPVVEAACQLEMDMQRQVACYFVQTWPTDQGPQLYVASEMSTVNAHADDHPVILVVRPALIKLGNSDREDYSMRKTLVPALVVLRSISRPASVASSPAGTSQTSEAQPSPERRPKRSMLSRSRSVHGEQSSRNWKRHLPRGPKPSAQWQSMNKTPV